MLKVYNDFFEKILLHSDNLMSYIDSLYESGHYSDKDLSEVFSVLKSEGLISCTFADNRIYNCTITTLGKHYLDRENHEVTNRPRLIELIEETEQIKTAFHTFEGAGLPSVSVIYDSQKFQEWIEELKYELQQLLISSKDPFIEEIYDFASQKFNGWSDKRIFSLLESKLKVIQKRQRRFFPEAYEDHKEGQNMKSQIFIVHGHDEAAKESAARIVERLGYEAVVLHEQPSAGKTIIEKIESYIKDVVFAIILYTECDIGRDKNSSIDDEKFRARQNVIFEHGLLTGNLGRDHVIALVKGNVEIPSDLAGIVYTSMDEGGAWKMELVKNMQAVGLDASVDKLL